MPDSIDFKRECIERDHPGLSVRRQCELLGLNRSSWYYQPAGESAENLQCMRRIDEQYLKTPFYGSRKMAEVLAIDRKRARRLMRLMGMPPWTTARPRRCTGPREATYSRIVAMVQINTKSRAKKGKPTCTQPGGYASAAARDLW